MSKMSVLKEICDNKILEVNDLKKRISKEELLLLATKMSNNQYGQYLLKHIDETR